MPDTQEAEKKPRIPDYKLKALDKSTGQTNEVGAAWENENGSIAIRLNLYIVLHHNPNLVLTLFPNR